MPPDLNGNVSGAVVAAFVPDGKLGLFVHVIGTAMSVPIA